MKIKDALKSINTIFQKVSDRLYHKRLKKENLLAMIEDNQNMLNILDTTIFSFNKSQQKEIYDKVLNKIKMDPNINKHIPRSVLNLITKLPSSLKGKARSMDPTPIAALAYTSTIMQKLLEDLSNSVDSIMEKNDEVVINQTKISQGLFVGVIKTADMYCDFVTFLFGIMSNIITGKNVDTAPKYMYDFIEKYEESFINVVNQLCNANGRYSVINDITNIRDKGIDFKFSANEKIGSSNVSRFFTDSLGFENIFLSLFSIAIRPIALLGEMYVDIRHDYYARMKERKAWLESHVALLTMELKDKDPNSPEYTKLVKIIEYYTEQISKYDKKLSKYYET